MNRAIVLSRAITVPNCFGGWYRGITGTFEDTGENAYGVELVNAMGIINPVRADVIAYIQDNDGALINFSEYLKTVQE